ncbi:MAG: lipid-A-disaccharide synthase [Saprospirales bacterium]|nr:MAG: lipid-A-disaccharide synthase [Saprospirales bacterium]
MKYYLLVGEASGDQHASYLIKSILKKDDQAEFRFWGGPLMEKASGEKPIKYIKELAFMGFWEVLVNLRTILRNFKSAKEDILNYKPDVLILVDYPGFNLRMAEWAHKKGIKTAYYIAPSAWAWKENRVKKLAAFTDVLLAILPFEEKFFRDRGVDQTIFTGHPLMDHFDSFEVNDQGFERGEKIFGIFPGSRKQEVHYMLPRIAPLFDQYPETTFGISKAKQLQNENQLYDKYIKGSKNVRILTDRQYDLFAHCNAALVKSGTSTLEAALLNVPQTVIYKANPISYSIAKRLVKVKYISLVNLILDEKLIEECIQGDVNAQRMARQFEQLHDPTDQQRIKNGYQRLREKLGGAGASDRAAEEVVKVASRV